MGWLSGTDGAGKLRVLVVDDDRASLASLEGVLSTDYEVVSCLSPRAALAFARAELKQNRHFDVVCSDFRMLEMDGAELLRRIAELPGSPTCMLVTGYVEVLNSEHLHASHIRGIVAKPYDPSYLIGLVEQFGRITRAKRSGGAAQLVSV
jgi:CheY-like chemotaxis protein